MPLSSLWCEGDSASAPLRWAGYLLTPAAVERRGARPVSSARLGRHAGAAPGGLPKARLLPHRHRPIYGSALQAVLASGCGVWGGGQSGSSTSTATATCRRSTGMVSNGASKTSSGTSSCKRTRASSASRWGRRCVTRRTRGVRPLVLPRTRKASTFIHARARGSW